MAPWLLPDHGNDRWYTVLQLNAVYRIMYTLHVTHEVPNFYVPLPHYIQTINTVVGLLHDMVPLHCHVMEQRFNRYEQTY